MAGWFELKKAKSGQFVFTLKSGNAQVVLTSEQYKTRKSAENGIASVQKNCQNDNFYDRKTAKNGKSYFTLKAGNGQVIGLSQMYASVATMNKGIASVTKNGCSDVVKDLVT